MNKTDLFKIVHEDCTIEEGIIEDILWRRLLDQSLVAKVTNTTGKVVIVFNGDGCIHLNGVFAQDRLVDTLVPTGK